MSVDLMERIAGTPAWVRATFTPKVQLRMRDELRKLQGATDALAAVVWLPDSNEGERIAFTGDLRAVPRRFPDVDQTVATPYDTVTHGERTAMIAQIVQLGRGLPSLRVATIAPEVVSPTVFEAVERTAARLERIAVAAL